MNKNDCLRKTDEILSARRAKAKERLAAHEAEIAATVPQIGILQKKLRAVTSEFFRAALEDDFPEEKFRDIKSRSLDLQCQIAEALHENGYAPGYLDLQYICPECEDTGFIGREMCKCYKKALSEVYLENSHLKTVCKNQSFRNYDLTFFEGDDRERMKKLLNFCRKYAAGFSEKSPNLLFVGTPGCGKTYLSCAIGTEVIRNGWFVLYAPVQELIDTFEAAKFGRDDAADTAVYTDCDLLIIDDLGTEMTTSFSESVLYNVVNTRLNLGKPMIISTNCTPEDMQGIYHDRLISRLVYDFVTLPFCNRDIRHEKKSRKAKK